MHSQADIAQVASMLLAKCNLTSGKCTILQTLWAGYGHICSIKPSQGEGQPKKPDPLILKYVSPPVRTGEAQDEGHLRKVISYQVEQYFYTHLAPRMPKEIAVASCLASIDAHNPSENITAMLLTDLKKEYPTAGEKQRELSENQVNAAIDWLANFHGFWWKEHGSLLDDRLRRPPLDELALDSSSTATRNGTVWLNGGYTYLATRMSEYADLADDDTSEWSKVLCTPVLGSEESLASITARFLTPTLETSGISGYQTLIHGDVKSENLFTTTNGNAVAFFDFQYVGLGLGVCDMAKLFTCSVPEHMLSENRDDGLMHSYEEALLRRYQSKVEEVSGRHYDWVILLRHWETALVDWLRFQASWGLWGNTDWLERRVRTIVNDSGWNAWLLNVCGIRR